MHGHYTMPASLSLSAVKLTRDYPCQLLVERMAGLEPATFCLASRHSTTELHPHVSVLVPPDLHVDRLTGSYNKYGGRDGIRTRGPSYEDPLLSKQVP